MSDRLKLAVKETSQAIDEVIGRLIPASREMESRLIEAMRYGVLQGGKRMRPLLVITTCELFNVDRSCALRVAAAIEMAHAYALIHDDLPAIDNSKLRRGRPSLHCAYDEATALLAGNALHAMAFDVLTHQDTHPDARIRIRLVEGLARAMGVRGNAGGQMLDLIGREENLDVGAITRMQKMKTGGLIMFACEAGAIMGKASPKHVVAMRNYAHDFGMTFQMMADLADVTKPRQDMGQDPKARRSSFLAHMQPGEAVAKARILVNQCIHHLAVFEPSRVEILVDLANSLLDDHR